MARGDAYATGPEFIDAHKGLAAPNPLLESQLKAVSLFLDRKLNRRAGFWLDATPVARYFRRTRPGLVLIDDIGSLEDLEIRGSHFAPADWSTVAVIDAARYDLMPANALADGWPVNSLEAVGGYAFPERLEIRARWGFPQSDDGPPAAIKIATIELTALVRVEGQRALRQTSLDVGTLLGTSRDAQNILTDLMKTYWRPE